MRSYELGIILHPQLEQDSVQQAVDKVSKYIEAGGGSVSSANVWGRRTLAYPIRHQNEGTYVFMQAQMEARALAEVERNLKLDENILRYLLVCLEE